MPEFVSRSELPAANGPDRAQGLDAKVAWLRRPASYPEPTERVSVVETHMAYVFLTDRHAWKLKKPVRLSFLDFSTLGARYRDGVREIALNRRLAPDVYLGLTPLVALAGGGFRLGGSGRIVDWLVEMRRLPAADMLDRRIAERRVECGEMDALVDVMADFYGTVPREPITGGRYRDWMRRQVEDDCDELRRSTFGLPRDLVEAVRDRQRRFLRERAAELGERADRRRIVEAHGDLRPEHICLTPPRPVVIDCLEFNREFRLLDPIDELSFLALECERLGAPWIGGRILSGYGDRTGDVVSASLRAFYRRLRACLRAKLAVWHLLDETVTDSEKWRARAQWYLEAALRAPPAVTPR